MSLSRATAKEDRIASIDGLRGLAIVLVFIYHTALIYSNNSHILAGATALPVRLVYAFALKGSVGVDLFFVLSGFLITGILYDTKGCAGYFRTFYARRVLRIFPLYYAVLAAGLLVVPRIMPSTAVSPADSVWFVAHLSNFYQSQQEKWGKNPAIEVAWSLSIEEQFYLVWPMIVMLFSRRALKLTSVVLVGVSLCSRAVLTLLGAGEAMTGLWTICRLDGLAVGAFIALAARSPESETWSHLRRWSPYGLAIAGFLAFVVPQIVSGAGYHRFHDVIFHTVAAYFFGALLVMSVASKRGMLARRIFERRLLRVFGNYSYALYLFHVPIIIIVWLGLFDSARPFASLRPTLFGQVLFLALTASLALLGAWLSWHLYERRFLALKRFFPYDPPAGPAETESPATATLRPGHPLRIENDPLPGR